MDKRIYRMHVSICPHFDDADFCIGMKFWTCTAIHLHLSSSFSCILANSDTVPSAASLTELVSNFQQVEAGLKLQINRLAPASFGSFDSFGSIGFDSWSSGLASCGGMWRAIFHDLGRANRTDEHAKSAKTC